MILCCLRILTINIRMVDVEGALTLQERLTLRDSLLASPDPFITALPKVELHIHIEGIITPALKWKFARRNNIPLVHPRTSQPFTSLEDYEASHESSSGPLDNTQETLSFFEAYYGGFAVLKTKQDYFDLAMVYYEKAASMNVRYAEIFFDPQGHTKNGVSWETMMGGFSEAQRAAEKFGVRSSWIMCILRDESLESAWEAYEQAIQYKDVIVGFGLDSNEDGRPPVMFDEIFKRARKDGFRITAHCDVGRNYPVENTRQVACVIGGGGADRIDHGLNAAEDPGLVHLVAEKQLGMTICPWSYIRHQPADEVFERIHVLFDAGVRINIASDDPAFMEDTWVQENLLVVKNFCKFTDREMLTLARDAVHTCWAPEKVKHNIMQEIEDVAAKHKVRS